MSDVAIRVRGLSKQFRIGAARQSYKTFRETVAALPKIPARFFKRFRSDAADAAPQTIWALRDLTFDVRAGEVLGVIGPNGAGKSTLLKILSRITEPTGGSAEIRGRVGSLLEVGTGFHGELTGRENVYLNGAILGMKRKEIGRKFEEIVAFAEVEKFIDTPVKHYSTGMYLRLAFAVAAHLEPDILIVDEVLAVGDARFQRKCLNTMQNVSQQGRTVFFVSHNMPAITRLCERAILLEGGRLVRDGAALEVVSEYLSSGRAARAAREWSAEDAPGRQIASLRAVRVRAEGGGITDTVDVRQPVRVEMEYDVSEPGTKLMPFFSFSTSEGVTAFSTNDADAARQRRPREIGRYVSSVRIPGNLLAEGTMFVAAGLTAIDPPRKQFFVRDVVSFQVLDTTEPAAAGGQRARETEGVVRPILDWNTEQVAESGSRLLEAEL